MARFGATARRVALTLGLAATALVALSPAAHAQSGPFAPVMIVNEQAITRFELDQRIRMLTLLRQPGDIEKVALEGLIEDRLRIAEGRRLGLRLPPETVMQGMQEFASRANLTAEQFVEALAQGGVEAQTFRDFVEAGMIWREVVRARYAGAVTVTDAEIDRAISEGGQSPAVRVLLSELAVPIQRKDVEGATVLAEELRASIRGEEAFAEAARRYSAAPTRNKGGELDWASLGALPGGVQAAVAALRPGEISEPVITPNAVLLFLMRDLQEDPQGTGTGQEVDYAEYLIPNDANAAAEAARIRAEVDACNDLYGIAKGQPEDRLTLRTAVQPGEVPGDVARELAALDRGESSSAIVRGGWRVFLMLCDRRPAGVLPPDRNEVRSRLLNQRLVGLADGYMEELRAEAIIREP